MDKSTAYAERVGQFAIRKAVNKKWHFVDGWYGGHDGDVDILAAIALHRNYQLKDFSGLYCWYEVDAICEKELGCSWAAIRALKDGWDGEKTLYSDDWRNVGVRLRKYADMALNRVILGEP